jgi:hypothetical protein
MSKGVTVFVVSINIGTPSLPMIASEGDPA